MGGEEREIEEQIKKTKKKKEWEGKGGKERK